jgi:hypothetical protein
VRSTAGAMTRGRDPRVSPNLVRWGAVFAGTVISLALFALVSTLWLALSYGDGNGWIADNLAWLRAGTAIGALLLAGLLSGYLSGVRGAGAGLLNGMTAWGLLFVASALTVVPGIAALTMGPPATGTGQGGGPAEIAQTAATLTPEDAAWGAFWALLIGVVVAAGGGVRGGAAKRSARSTDNDGGLGSEHEPHESEPSSLRLDPVTADSGRGVHEGDTQPHER